MSEVRLVIRDAEREIHSDAHGSIAEYVVAALSAEPETIEELAQAMGRFVAPGPAGPFAHFRPGADDRPHDAGVVIVDLAARLVAYKNTYCQLGWEGYVSLHDGQSTTDVDVRYHLPEDWEFTDDLSAWRARADRRRRTRLDNPPLDARAVLYGQAMLEFVACECLALFAVRPPAAEGTDAEEEEYDLVRDIHARWLTTPREDLRGAAPRDVILARHDFIEWDLQDRAEQWSRTLQPPQTLSPQSVAYRFGGFGTHETVIYYDLVRDLIWFCRSRMGQAAPEATAPAGSIGQSPADLMPRLAEFRDEWLEQPVSDFGNHIPRQVIQHERIRLPEACSGEDAVVDPDCPLCQMSADLPGPTFWHLDGCNMDDDFAFSFHRTLEEYEQEKRRDEEFNRRWQAEKKERERLGVQRPDACYWDPDYAWDSSFSTDTEASASLFIRLFTIGSHLCEITAALHSPTEERPLIDRLSRDYGNLREVVNGQDVAAVESLLGPVLDRFCQTLDAVAAARPDLEAKCAALQARLTRFTAPPEPGADNPSDAEEGDFLL